MKNPKLKTQNYRLLFCILHFALCITAISAQSNSQNFPTPVTSNEISGTIKARDIGDSRLTSYFYTFNGNQGDIFINVVTKNLDGDIDIFTADNLRPLTKITVYSDNPDSETGRVIYLRQPQKLILRVEGRTPTDDPATFRIKFAGTFQALAGVAETEDSKSPEVKSNEESDVRVNSVGTIIEVKPKPTPTPKQSVAKVEKPKQRPNPADIEPQTTEPTKTKETSEEKEAKTPVSAKKDTPVKLEDPNEGKLEENVLETETNEKKEPVKKEVKPKKTRTVAKSEAKPKPNTEKKPAVAPVEPSQLENIRLIVEFKDGTKIERPMSEILKFSVDKGILTIIAKDGNIGRYSILDVLKMTVE